MVGATIVPFLTLETIVNPFYSVVIPLKNEAGNIAHLIEELEPVMNSLSQPWELICIDDGSTDGTAAILNALQVKKPSCA